MGETSHDGLAPEAELNEPVSEFKRGTYAPAGSNERQNGYVSLDDPEAALQHASQILTDNVEPYNDNGPHPWSDDNEGLNMTAHQAFEYLNRVTREPYIDPSHDTTIQDVLDHQFDWVKSLMRAILNFDQVFDKPGSSPLTKVKKTSKHKVEAVSHRVFHTFIDRCLHGYRGDPKQDKAIPSTTPNTANPPDTELICQERMKAVVGTLQTYKCVCISVIDDGKFDAIANHPLALRLTKDNERKNNDGRAAAQEKAKNNEKIMAEYGLLKKDGNGKILAADADTYRKLQQVKLQDKTTTTSNRIAKSIRAANTVSPAIGLSIASNRHVSEKGRVQGSMPYDIVHASQPSCPKSVLSAFGGFTSTSPGREGFLSMHPSRPTQGQRSSYHEPSRDPAKRTQGHMTAKQFKEPKYWHSEALSQATQSRDAQYRPVVAARPETSQRKRERSFNQDPHATEHVSPPNFKKARTMEHIITGLEDPGFPADISVPLGEGSVPRELPQGYETSFMGGNIAIPDEENFPDDPIGPYPNEHLEEGFSEENSDDSDDDNNYLPNGP
ncbi:hypothetical protein SLS60_008466 [Paraconiothyrium brasiliense]|uniref:Uncharacterized protein n=1 Tax=Paraconiothyrium brasiliense TaxID=300254 RepID=A0ABR3R0Z9_9PLEO